MVFDNLWLNEGKLSFNYTKPFEILSQAVKFTNGSKLAKLAEAQPKIFEPGQNLTNASKNRALDPEFDALLRR